ncbi:MAG: hypothetical protein ACPHCN_14365 [Mycobacterium sp.]
MTKPWWQSKTIWLNLVAFAVAVIGAGLDTELIRSSPQAVYVATVALAGANMALRFVTGRPITGMGQ